MALTTKLTPELNDYDYTVPQTYNQYKEVNSLNSFMDVFSLVCRNQIQNFLNAFGNYINLSVIQTNKYYSKFYALYYFGINDIPNPSDFKAITKDFYDENTTVWDKKDLRYDDLASTDSTAYGLDPLQFLVVAKFILNYSHRVFSMPVIFGFLKDWYEVSSGSAFDPFSLKIVYDPNIEDRIIIRLPKEEAWEKLRLIARYQPDLLGLPYGDNLGFEIEEDEDEDEDEDEEP